MSIEGTYCAGQLTVSTIPREMRMSHWVYAPKVTDSCGRLLFDLTQSLWDLLQVKESPGKLELLLRKYPGSGIEVSLTIHSGSGEIFLGGSSVSAADLERTLESTHN